MQEIDPVNLRMPSRQWEKLGLLPSGKALDHASMYGTGLSDEKNAESMMRMFVGLPAEIIAQGVSMIHEEFSEFFCSEYFDYESDNKGSSLALLCGIQQCFTDIQNRCVLATDDLSRLVIETAGQRPATLKYLQTQELALDMQTRLLELRKFQSIGSLQEEIAKKFCRFQIQEEGTKLNSATQNAIGCALALLLDTNPWDDDDVPKLTIKKLFAICSEKFCSINGTPIGGLIDEGMLKERALLAQEVPNSKVPFANSNGQSNNSNSTDSQFAKLKKDLTLAQWEIAKLKNQLHQARQNITKERAEHSSKSKKDDSPEDEVGSKRGRQQANRAKASMLELSSPIPPGNGFRILPTGEYS
jgi:hypothetical protein